jgi:hypothetical protein
MIIKTESIYERYQMAKLDNLGSEKGQFLNIDDRFVKIIGSEAVCEAIIVCHLVCYSIFRMLRYHQVLLCCRITSAEMQIYMSD